MTSRDHPLVLPADAARIARARTLIARALVIVPIVALVVVAAVAATRPRLSLIILTAVFVAALAVTLVQAIGRRRAIARAADASGTAFVLDDRGIYFAGLATTIEWREVTGILHWDRSIPVRRATAKRVWGVGPRFVAATGGTSHHLTFGLHDGAAVRARIPHAVRSAVGVDGKKSRGTVVVLPDVALSAHSTALLLEELRRRAESRGIPFVTATSALDWAAAGATLGLAR